MSEVVFAAEGIPVVRFLACAREEAVVAFVHDEDVPAEGFVVALAADTHVPPVEGG